MFNPKYHEAKEKLKKVLEDFGKNGGYEVDCICPVCGNTIKVDCYNKNDLFYKNDGVILCNKCDHYIEYKIMEFNDDLRMLLREYHHAENIDLDNRMLNYVTDNLSIDDWKIILNSNNIKKIDGFADIIKNILESKGYSFDEENNEEEGE